FCGMGGSGATGLYASKILETHSDTVSYPELSHQPPSWIDKYTLVITLSYSGNTLETLHCARKALEKNASIIAVTRGGELSKLENSRAVAIVPEAPAPRAGFTGMLYTTLGILEGLGVINGDNIGISESLKFLKNQKRSVYDHARNLAEWLRNIRGTPVIVTGASMCPVAVRAKNELAENSKTKSIIGCFPESGHNDIVAWASEGTDNLLIIFTGEDFEDKTLQAALSIISPLSTHRLTPAGEKLLTRLIYPTWTIGIASIEYAVMRGIDPVEITPIDNYKRKLKLML
ncbi:MAG: SIS domain-containing protein, partial [Desulfurococcales archaeon]|nr:SIS domain-containing protein [Desulfurococcales archaeon]